MRHQEYTPPEPLRDAIRCFWHNSRNAGPAVSSFDVMPDGYAEIVFYFGDCKVMPRGTPHVLASPFLVGLLDQPFTVEAGGRLDIIAIRCFPWTVFELLGVAPGFGGVMPLTHPIGALHPVLAAHVAAGRIDAAMAALGYHLVDALPRPVIDVTVAKAGMALRAAQGKLPVSQAAAAAHATVRTLERKFKQTSGHTVKDVARLIRFEQVRNRLWQAPAPDLAILAQELGYTDQSHLSREFKRYSGMTPTAFAARQRRDRSG